MNEHAAAGAGADELTAVRVVISGRVQGVGFRFHLADQARRAGARGWCRNRPDGTVEAVVGGEETAVWRVVNWCHQGPPSAEVDEVRVERDVALPASSTFEVRG